MNITPNLGSTEVVYEPGRIVLKPVSDDDRARLRALVPEETSGFGKWATSITFAVGTLLFRTQTPADQAKLSQLCPADQTAKISVAWADDCVELTVITDIESRPSAEQQELARVNAMNDADLQTLAAEVGVEWDTAASRKTMVERVVAAAIALRAVKETPPATAPPAKPKGKGK